MRIIGRIAAAIARAIAPVGGCRRCRWPWAFVAPHETPIDDAASVAPLCEGCWAALDPAGRWAFYERALRRWDEGRPAHLPPMPQMTIDRVRAAVEAGL